jgi:hypothetical protein
MRLGSIVEADRMIKEVGTQLDVVELAARFRTHRFVSDTGFVLFVECEPGVYKITVGFKDGARGQAAVDAINEAYSLLFETTTAEKVVGCWNAGGPVSAIAPLIRGGEWVTREGMCYGNVTKERWLKAGAQ